jgi:hypothetical protein
MHHKTERVGELSRNFNPKHMPLVADLVVADSLDTCEIHGSFGIVGDERNMRDEVVSNEEDSKEPESDTCDSGCETESLGGNDDEFASPSSSSHAYNRRVFGVEDLECLDFEDGDGIDKQHATGRNAFDRHMARRKTYNANIGRTGIHFL